jgi:hypothetical protein
MLWRDTCILRFDEEEVECREIVTYCSDDPKDDDRGFDPGELSSALEEKLLDTLHQL